MAVAADFKATGAALQAVAELPVVPGSAKSHYRRTAAIQLVGVLARLQSDWAATRGRSTDSPGLAPRPKFDGRAATLSRTAAQLQAGATDALGQRVDEAMSFVGWVTWLLAGLVAALVVAAVAVGRRVNRRLADEREADIRDVVIYAMARLAESRDTDTGAHLDRVRSYSRVLAERIAAAGRHAAADAEFVDLVYRTSPLHDIGKVGIPDAILNKPGKLTPAEFDVMKRHASIGAETLGAAVEQFPDVRFLRVARSIAAAHHERWDGTGYPARLAGEAIPLSGRVVALADVYDALTTRRVYKPAYAHAEARAMIAAESGKHFDPAVVAAFMGAEAEFDAIRGRLAAEPTDTPTPAAPPPTPAVGPVVMRVAA